MLTLLVILHLLHGSGQDLGFLYDSDGFSAFSSSFQPHISLSSLRVLTLNLFLRPPLVKNNESDYKDLRTAYFIQHIFPLYDLICLQEVFGFMNYRKSQLIEEAKLAGFYYTAESPQPGTFSGYMIDGGLLILSRLPIVETEFWPYKDSVMPDSMAQKGVLYAQIQAGNATLHIFTSHVQSSYQVTDVNLYRKYRETRRLQLQQLREFVYLTTHDTGFVLVLGDLNVDSRESVKANPFPEVELDDYQVMTEIMGPGTVDLAYVAYGEHPITFGKRKSDGEPDETVLSDKAEQGGEFSLDYLFLLNSTPEVRIKPNSTRVAEFYVQNQPFTQVSDHFGLETTIELMAN